MQYKVRREGERADQLEALLAISEGMGMYE